MLRRWLLPGIAGFLLSFLLFFHNFFVLLYDEGFYAEQFAKNNVNVEDKENMTQLLLAYFKWHAAISESGDFFSERERIHLEDVMDLIYAANVIYWLLIISFAIVFAAIFFKAKSQLWSSGAVFLIAGAFMILFLGLAAAALFNFDKAFIGFHEVLFTNDFWQLNPQTDHLIQMFPQQFFVDFVFMTITKLFLAAVICLAAAGILMWMAKNQAKKD